jgi:hypothetical protein
MKPQISIKTLWFKLPNISQKIILTGAIFLFVFGFYCLIMQNQRSCCDASIHLENAYKINTDGITSIKEPMRTFAYPWLLSLLVFANQGLNLPLILLVFLLQISIYYIAVLATSHIVHRFYGGKLHGIVYCVLCSNFFVIPYLGITLPDGLIAAISILLITWIIETESQEKLNIKWIIVASFLLNLAVMLDPAAVWLIGPVFYCWLKLLWRRTIDVQSFTGAILVGAIPLLVQILLNSSNFNINSFFPMAYLREDTIKSGIEIIKKANWIGDEPTKIFYSSKNLINLLSGEHNLNWYLNNPLDSAKLLIFKLIAAFDFDYLVAYPHQLPQFKWLASFFSFSILWAGIFGTLVHLFTKRLLMLGSRFMPILIFLSWSVFSLLPPVELRNTLPLISYFLIVSLGIINLAIFEKNKKILWPLIAGWIIFMPIFFWIANLIRLQS